MPAPAEILKEAHRLMRYIADLEARITAGPKALRSAQLALQKQEDVLKKAQEDIKQYKVKILERESAVKQQQQQIDKLDKTSVNNRKEYEAIKTEIASHQKSIKNLEDEALEFMGWIEEKQGQLPTLDKAVQQAKADLARVEKENQEKMGQYAAEQQRAKGELAELEKTLPPEVSQPYQRLVGVKGADALGGVQDRICTACYTEITHQMRNELLQGMFVSCKNCGRMLFIA